MAQIFRSLSTSLSNLSSSSEQLNLARAQVIPQTKTKILAGFGLFAYHIFFVREDVTLCVATVSICDLHKRKKLDLVKCISGEIYFGNVTSVMIMCRCSKYSA